jgi:hypothetical protein
LALSGQISIAGFCPLLDNSGQRWGLTLGGPPQRQRQIILATGLTIFHKTRANGTITATQFLRSAIRNLLFDVLCIAAILQFR